MFQKRLVPLDGTPLAAAALSVAAELGRAMSARVVLIEVVASLPRWGQGWSMAPHWEEGSRGRVQRYLDHLVDGLRQQGLAAEHRSAVGEVAPTIVATADEVGADLIVMSTHALTGPARALIGSVADRVMREASHPVVLIRQSGE